MSGVACLGCRQLVAEEFMEEGRCVGCQAETKKYAAIARQAAIDGGQVTRRNAAVSSGQARRFMGRFSGRLGRSR